MLVIKVIDIYTVLLVAQDSSVGVATRYVLDGPDIESRWGTRQKPTCIHMYMQLTDTTAESCFRAQ
jgi:hypothetical protein